MTGMFERVLALGGVAEPKKKRQSTGTVKKNPLQEALRARGGTTNVEAVVAHRRAESDTEAFAPAVRRPVERDRPLGESLRLPGKTRQSLPGPKGSARRSARTDDDLDAKSTEASLGWLDLQAFAPQAWQKQLERLKHEADNVRERFFTSEEGEEKSEVKAQGGGSSSSKSGSLRDALKKRGGAGMVAALPKPQAEEKFGFTVGEQVMYKDVNDDFPEGTLGTILHFLDDQVAVQFPKSTWMFWPTDLVKATSEFSRLLDILHEPETDSAETSGPREALKSDMSMMPLTPVPEDEEVSPPIQGNAGGTELPAAEEAPVAEDEDKLAASTREAPTADPEQLAAPHAEAPSVDSPWETATPTESTIAESNGGTRETTDSSAAEAEAPEHGADALAAGGREGDCQAAIEVALEPSSPTRPADEVPCRASSAPDLPAPVTPAAPTVVTEAAAQLSQLRPVREPLTRAATPQTQAPAWATAQQDQEEGFIVEATSPSQAKAPTRPPRQSWCPHATYDAPRSRAVTEPAGKSEEAKATKEKGTVKDMRDFWGKHQVRFAGPSQGAKSMSKNEAQAALQRLVSNGACCDPSEIRRLKKLVDA